MVGFLSALALLVMAWPWYEAEQQKAAILRDKALNLVGFSIGDDDGGEVTQSQGFFVDLLHAAMTLLGSQECSTYSPVCTDLACDTGKTALKLGTEA